MLLHVCSVIDHRRHQNMARKSVPLFCSYHILMSSVIYYLLYDKPSYSRILIDLLEDRHTIDVITTKLLLLHFKILRDWLKIKYKNVLSRH